MAFQEKPLGQARENSTSAVTVYSPAAGVTGVISTIELCNTTGSAVTFSLFIHATGTTYDASTALHFNADLTANQTLTKNGLWALDDSNGSVGYSNGTANAVTISLFGAEISDD